MAVVAALPHVKTAIINKYLQIKFQRIEGFSKCLGRNPLLFLETGDVEIQLEISGFYLIV